ncbi:MAG: HindVP family restriction endonuclease [Lachnospiraceae bacterium]|jgi:hypothetical protein|nr:HindVP family restriction endonuclease [Lachnospiraceae bacterium]
MTSGLYGIYHSSRNSDEHWGKNCINSSFPTALACYMLDNDIPAVYNRLENIDGELKVISTEISLREVFSSGNAPLSDLDFRFEEKYAPYQEYSFDPIDGIDLIVKDVRGRFL